MITIAYITNRIEPKIEWFFDSLRNQIGSDPVKVIVVDFHAEASGRKNLVASKAYGLDVLHIPPKPSIWCGPSRVTNADCFDASGFRNTALLHCETDFIVYADDLSVLDQSWYREVKIAAERRGWTFGSYRKVNDLSVVNGTIAGFSDHEQGHDSRWPYSGQRPKAFKCPCEWLFGCSLVAPVDDLLDIGGWPEFLCGGMGYEDSALGVILKNRKTKTFFAPRMLTYEDNNMHLLSGQWFSRRDPCRCNPCTTPRNDKSHAMLDMVSSAIRSPMNGDIRSERINVITGKGYDPLPEHPVEWFTGKPLNEFDFK